MLSKVVTVFCRCHKQLYGASVDILVPEHHTPDMIKVVSTSLLTVRNYLLLNKILHILH